MGMISFIRSEIAVIRERDPAIKSSAEVILYPTFWAILSYRTAHKWYEKGHYFWARWLSQKSARRTGIEIHPGAQIGEGLFIDHGHGVVIGETAILGDNVTLYQGVTLGGNGKEKGKRHPTLGNNVMVGCGAKVLGPFKIGDNVKIAANAVVLEEIPENSTAVGAPARVVRRNGIKVTQDLDQIHIPDPISQELCRQRIKIDELEKQIKELKNK